MRQLAIGRARIERQLVTGGAAILHRDRLEVLAVRLETMTVRAVERLAVAPQHAIRIEMLVVRELHVRLLDGLVERCDLGLPFELEARAGLTAVGFSRRALNCG